MGERFGGGAGYWGTRGKGGLVTSSAAAASKAAAIPLTSVVLPAPRSPRSSTSFGAASNAASVRPKAIVSSAECVVISCSTLLALVLDPVWDPVWASTRPV